MPKPRPQPEDERHPIEALIREAFANVTRAGGISWSETDALDLYLSDEERVQLRAKDTEKHWTDLVDDPRWQPEPGVGGFPFLDPIGCRYYLAPAMIRCVRAGGIDVPLLLLLCPPKPTVMLMQARFKALAGDNSPGKKPGKKPRSSSQDLRLSLLTPQQRAAVAAFLKLMSTRGAYRQECAEAYEKDWARRDPENARDAPSQPERRSRSRKRNK